MHFLAVIGPERDPVSSERSTRSNIDRMQNRGKSVPEVARQSHEEVEDGDDILGMDRFNTPPKEKSNRYIYTMCSIRGIYKCRGKSPLPGNICRCHLGKKRKGEEKKGENVTEKGKKGKEKGRKGTEN
jgi:hypothetical protein